MAGVALVFNGPIGHPATTRLRTGLCGIANEQIIGPNNQPMGRRYDKIYLLLNSGGGAIDDGFSLYSLLRTLSAGGIEITTVNMGLVASIANVIFLGGDKRIAVPNSLFHFHNFEWNINSAQTWTREKFSDWTNILDSSRAQNVALLKSRTSLTDADFETLKLLDSPMVRDATFAKDKGIVQEIGFPDLPVGTVMLNADY
jgi:ATP-dependent protease ClpP protease subunit